MVATYVEIIFGIKLTDKEACKILLDMSEKEYDRHRDEEDLDSVFANFADFKYIKLKRDFDVFTCICCSDTTDVIVGVSLRKIYRLFKRCDNCKEYSLCEECFNSTEQGSIDFHETYSFKYKLEPHEVCNYCNSYNKNGKEGDKCRTCLAELEPYNSKYLSNKLKKDLNIDREASLYFHWSDCGSCS